MDSIATSFNTNPPRASAEQIRRLIEDAYGLEVARVEALTSERDLTSRVTTRGGDTFVFKIANSGDDPGVIEFQNRALQYIEQHDPTVPVQRVVANANGTTELTVRLDGVNHATRLLTFLKGVPAISVASTARLRGALGASLGRLTLALRGFSHPSDDHVIMWDLKNLGQLLRQTGNIDDPAKRKEVERRIEYFLEKILPGQASLRTQVVHNDFNLFNVMLSAEDPDQVVGIIDFGDLVKTPIVYDVAVALSFQVAERDHPLAYPTDLLSAYHRACPLKGEEIELLFDLIAARHAMTITISEWRAKLYPHNRTYILKNNARSSAALMSFAAIDRGAARRLFEQACGYSTINVC